MLNNELIKNNVYKKNLIFYYNYYIFFYKYRVFIFLKFCKNNLDRKLKFILFFKKKNIFFKNDKKIERQAKTRILTPVTLPRKVAKNILNTDKKKVINFFKERDQDLKKDVFNKLGSKLYSFFF